MPNSARGKDAVTRHVVEHSDLAGADGGGDLTLQIRRDPHVTGQVVDVVDARHLHRLQCGNVP